MKPAPNVLAVDPGKHRAGVALVVDGQLRKARVSSHSPTTAQPVVIEAWRSISPLPDCGVVVIERPQVYRAGTSKGNPNDLVDVALSAGAWGHAGHGLGWEIEYVLPADWKGQVPKRVARLCAREVLYTDELALVPRIALTRGGEDMWDAIVLALVRCGRLRLR